VTLGHSTGVTDTGRKRRHNEDSFVVEPPLFAVADGMGGAQAGELASGLAAAALRDDREEGTTGEERVAALIQEANRRVYQRSSEDASASGMGTTMTVALVEDGSVAFGHVGDSRAYLVREGSLEQLTEDHSLVAELVRSGKLSPEEAEVHPQRSVITRALGTDPDVDIDTFSVSTHPGDVFLICSDGLTSMIDEGLILDEVNRHGSDLKAAAKALIAAANRGGGEDNITVVAFEIVGDGNEPERLEETKPMPAVTEPTADADDEETLDELDQVPAVQTMVVPPGEAERLRAATRAEPEEEEPRGRRRTLPALAVLLILILAAAVLVWSLWGR
jgi:serine/threonine protein phosphatase PrpC